MGLFCAWHITIRSLFRIVRNRLPPAGVFEVRGREREGSRFQTGRAFTMKLVSPPSTNSTDLLTAMAAAVGARKGERRC